MHEMNRKPLISPCEKIEFQPPRLGPNAAATVEPLAKFLPAWEPGIHQLIEHRAVSVDGEMRQLMHNDILNQFTRRTRQRFAIGDVPFSPMAASPKRLHLANPPCEVAFAEPSSPTGVEFIQQRGQDHPFRVRNGLTRRTRQDLAPRLYGPIPFRLQERLALRKRRAKIRDGKPHHAVLRNAQIDSPNAFADNLNRNAVDFVSTNAQHMDRARQEPRRPATSRSHDRRSSRCAALRSAQRHGGDAPISRDALS